MTNFEFIWLGYPSKIGRKQAEKHFRASVRTEADWVDMRTALRNYLDSKRVKQGFIMNGSTWFNNWRDWVTAPKEQEQWVKP